MRDEDKTQAQLIEELQAARQQITNLEETVKTARYDYTEKLSRSSEKRYYELVELTPVAMFIATDQHIVFANPAGLLLLGASELDAVSCRPLSDFIHPDDQAAIRTQWQTVSSQAAQIIPTEHRLQTLDGSSLYVETVAAPIVYNFRLSALLVVNDITPRRRAEEAYHVLVNHSQQGLAIMQDDQVVFVNPALPKVFGYPPEELMGLSASEVNQKTVHPDDKHILLQRFYDRQAGKPVPSHYESRIIRPDGAVRWLETAVTSIEYQGRPATQTTVLDITERKQNEEQLRKYKRIVSATTDYIALLDPHYVYLIVNTAYANRHKKSQDQIIGRSVSDILGDDVFETAIKPGLDRAMTGETVRYQEWFVNIQGRRFLDVTYAPYYIKDKSIAGVVVSIRDLTEQKLLEERLRQSQKMEALGQLAGGVAHHYNNMLTAIIGYVSLAQTELPATHPIVADLERVLETAQRAAALTHQLLTFTRRQLARPQPVELNDLIQRLSGILQHLIPATIEFQMSLTPESGQVKMDAAQFEQLLMNLVRNACEAMPTVGQLRLQTKHVIVTKPPAGQQETVPPGSYALLTVADNGVGMTEAVKAHLFEPFFTTKEVGQGTGLGLSTCYGIVTQHDGYITVDSQPGQGSAFHIYLPRLDPTNDVGDNETSSPLPTGQEIILIVEDEETVRRLLTNMLRRQGYQVITAEHGIEALQQLRGQPDLIPDLLLTDVVMPSLDGQALASQLRDHLPRLKVIFMSGYSADHVPHLKNIPSTDTLLTKPFSPAILLRAVRQALDEN